jgi:ferredoxin-NADP reductase
MTDISPRTSEAVWQNARIVGIVQRTARIKSFFFHPTTPFAHRAGQHLDLRLTAPDGYQAMRSYSIASAADDTGILELVIDRLDDGEVSPFFHDVARLGDEIEIRGPLGGHFVWQPADGGPLLLLAGGSGIAPLMAMIRQREQERSDVPMLLVLSSRTLAETLYVDELRGIEASGNRFWLRLALTRGAPPRPVDYGRRIDSEMITDAIGLLGHPRHVFVCGSNAFANAAADSAVVAGIDPATIRTERYGG